MWPKTPDGAWLEAGRRKRIRQGNGVYAQAQTKTVTGKAARGWQEEKAGLKNTMRLQQLVQSHRPVPLFQFHCPLLCPVLSTSRGEKLPTLACLPQQREAAHLPVSAPTNRSCPPSRVCLNKLPTFPCLPQQTEAAHPPVSAPTSCPPSPVCPNTPRPVL